MKVIPLIFTREFPVTFCEIWGKSYRQFWDIETKTIPRNIFILQNGLVYDYRNPDLIKELQDLFYSRAAGQHKYLYGLYLSWLKQYRQLEEVWSHSYLTRAQLKLFGKLIQKFWPAMFASMFIPDDRRFSKIDRDLMVKLRAKIGDTADKATYIIDKTLRKIYPELGRLALYLKLNDISKGNINKNKLLRLSRRKLVMVDDRFIPVRRFQKYQREYNFKLNKLRIDRGRKSVSGQVAYRGQVEGRVKIVQKRSDLANFNKGEVLVSAMTVPDFIPAMKKAAAIVTDEGGVTCHAAIVARELKIPCVIGTKIATKVFKDGDKVEVDAMKGGIKKL